MAQKDPIVYSEAIIKHIGEFGMGIGLLRLLFALSIVFTHAGKVFGFNFADAAVAVESFYIISGFYMALILNEKYKKISSFFINRFLRLYPMYYTVLILTIVLGIKIPSMGTLNPITLLTLITTNLVIFGQDVMMFLGINAHGIFYFTSNFRAETLPAHLFLFIPQAWTIAIEITFYLFAPFLVRLKNNKLITLLGLSLWLRWFLATRGLSDDPWSYRFFPLELAFFILGILSYNIYRALEKRKKKTDRRITLTAVFLILGIIIFFQYIPLAYVVKQWAYYCILTLLLPLAFMHSQKSGPDRNIGDLSYPIYISHVFIMEAIRVYSPWLTSYLTFYHPQAYPVVIAAASIAFSWIVLFLIQRPIEKIRQKLALRTEFPITLK